MYCHKTQFTFVLPIVRFIFLSQSLSYILKYKTETCLSTKFTHQHKKIKFLFIYWRLDKRSKCIFINDSLLCTQVRNQLLCSRAWVNTESNLVVTVNQTRTHFILFKNAMPCTWRVLYNIQFRQYIGTSVCAIIRIRRVSSFYSIAWPESYQQIDRSWK